MNDKLKELYEKVSGDDKLKESFIKGLEAISNDDEKKDYIINFAKEQGVTLTMDDFDTQQLSDDDLENISGGRAFGWNAYRACEDAARAACAAALGTAGFMDC
ncbi:MAG: Nif11-like leader peptide family RiPP precursor [Lachnospiraceae bacterium]|nr:Nif11-like leader peptide family RiPP precursor [Lachnospiraceae bacterium]